MPELNFDESKSFDANLEDFITSMEGEDAELGAILREHISELKGATYEKARRDARTSFNDKVIKSLDQLSTPGSSESSSK